MKALIIVDPQNDFIDGTLPVEGADLAMNNLAMNLIKLPVDKILVTSDCHPIHHMSFDREGGIWPPHCMKYSEGAAIWAPLFKAIIDHSAEVIFIEKGTDVDKEEYSAFEEHYPKILDNAEAIYLCGIAGNVCVLNTLKDLIRHGLSDKIIVIEDVSPSLDDGSALSEVIKVNGVGHTKLENIIKSN